VEKSLNTHGTQGIPDVTSATAPLSPTVRALGLVSLCTDMSSEMVYPITPIFLTRVLGAPPWTVGLIEGVAESTASLLKLYSGWMSDRLGQRKPFAIAGYGLAAISKPLIAVAGAWGHVLGARFLDRTGKGLRAAPRDALIAENCPADQRGRAFGFHRSMDTTGAVLGPLLGYWFLHSFPGQFRWLYALAFIPALLGVLLLAFFVREQKAATAEDSVRKAPPLPSWRSLSGLSPDYRRYLMIVGLFGIGNSSDAFLLLRAQDMGVNSAHLLLLYALFNTVEALLGYNAGRLSDRVGRRPLLACGYAVFALVYLGFALLHGPAAVWVLFTIYGLYYTLTQGTQKALAADLAHPERRGTEIGAFHFLVGLAALPASLIAGWLYSHVAPAAPFLVGACTAATATLLLLNSKSQLLNQN
jgi:MFS family permease